MEGRQKCEEWKECKECEDCKNEKIENNSKIAVNAKKVKLQNVQRMPKELVMQRMRNRKECKGRKKSKS